MVCFQNTLAAIADAAKMGCDIIQVDRAVSRQKMVVSVAEIVLYVQRQRRQKAVVEQRGCIAR